jgi:hypothetical protein
MPTKSPIKKPYPKSNRYEFIVHEETIITMKKIGMTILEHIDSRTLFLEIPKINDSKTLQETWEEEIYLGYKKPI